MKASSELWLCCLCGLEKHPFGTLACDSTCDHRKTPHLTGLWYLAPNEGSDGKPVGSIGIAAISDEADVKKDGE